MRAVALLLLAGCSSAPEAAVSACRSYRFALDAPTVTTVMGSCTNAPIFPSALNAPSDAGEAVTDTGDACSVRAESSTRCLWQCTGPDHWTIEVDGSAVSIKEITLDITTTAENQCSWLSTGTASTPTP